MNLVIFGPPGAGKGTQSKYIVNKYNLYQLSTGELLRKEIINKTKLGLEISYNMNTGNLVSDKIVSDLIEKYISSKDYKNRLIFDGYPRNISQAENLNFLLKRYNQKIDLVLKLSVSLEVITKRIAGRSVCSICGKIYNEFYNPAPINSDCCASKYLQKRSDDTLDIAVSRFKTYENNIKPVIDFYRDMKLLNVVNGEISIHEITNEISALIERIKG
jgi:adenylate kinase|tara:strand:+ start:82 stop:732 length:651 start_codon:yes stop_codon:yes gene_type:complete